MASDPDAARLTINERRARLEGQKEVLASVGLQLAEVALKGSQLSRTLSILERAERWRALIFDGNLELVRWVEHAASEVRTELLLLEHEAKVTAGQDRI